MYLRYIYLHYNSNIEFNILASVYIDKYIVKYKNNKNL
jgi:hypothetical protein